MQGVDDVENSGHRVHRRRRHKVGIRIRTIGLVPGFHELRVAWGIEIVRVARHHDQADGRVAHVRELVVGNEVHRADETHAGLAHAQIAIGLHHAAAGRVEDLDLGIAAAG